MPEKSITQQYFRIDLHFFEVETDNFPPKAVSSGVIVGTQIASVQSLATILLGLFQHLPFALLGIITANT